MIRVSNLKVPIALSENEDELKKRIARAMAMPKHIILDYTIFRRSLDARKKGEIYYVYTVDVTVENPERVLQKKPSLTLTPQLQYELPKGSARPKNRPVVVGFGPAGMFCGLILAELGLRPLILERGGDVTSRKEAVDLFWGKGILDTENNVQFGAGGAGTFSDGKLTTRIKDLRCRKVLETFVEAGAKNDILFEAKPHIGTDILQGVVTKMADMITTLGGEIRYHAKVVDTKIENGVVVAVELQNKEVIPTNDLVLAVGHSARDTFSMLHEKGMHLEQKPFAVGVRIEHTQEMIQHAQFDSDDDNLPKAEYALTHTTKNGRGVYTFCMCPGGYVVGAASEENRLAINGMSFHSRDGKNANSAVLVQVYPADFPSEHPLSGIEFQRSLEEKAFQLGGSDYTAPVQRVGEFLQLSNHKNELQPTYLPKTKSIDMAELFPPFIIESLREALPVFGKKLKGFHNGDGILTAVESRSSSPVRMVRNEHFESTAFSGLYPAGEGAGYAGGIISAAVDGIRVAEQIFEKYKES
ncbi:MAG: hypothetical protein R3Y53_03110 [Bacillota bacterium]